MKDCVIDRAAVLEAMQRGGKDKFIRSFRQLSIRLEVDPRQVSRWMNGAPFNSASLAKMAEVLRVKPGKLIRLTERDGAYYNNNSSHDIPS